MTPIPIGQTPAPVTAENTREKFRQLAAVWRAETAYLSSSTAIAEHAAYQEIIRMGPEVVPLLLDELEREPDHWFAALRAITGANPVRPEHRGKINRMAEDWVRWGREQGHQW